MWRENPRCLEVILLFLIMISAPQVLNPGEIYTVNVSYSFDSPKNITFYEYVFKNLTCISNGWTSNKRNVIIKNGNFTIYDKIKENAKSGVYKLRVRSIINGKKVDRTVQVAVIQKQDYNIYYLISAISSAGGIAYILKKFR